MAAAGQQQAFNQAQQTIIDDLQTSILENNNTVEQYKQLLEWDRKRKERSLKLKVDELGPQVNSLNTKTTLLSNRIVNLETDMDTMAKFQAETRAEMGYYGRLFAQQ